MTRSQGVDISKAPSPQSFQNRVMRVVWGVVQGTLFRMSPRPMHRWRAFLLRVFGADVSFKARVYPKAKIWAPWNLTMGEYATLADDVDCYCVNRISIGAHTTISQYSYLCGATHDFDQMDFPLRPKPIIIGSQVWVAADCFIAPGVTIPEGVVVGARSSVFSDPDPWTVCSGTPAKKMKDRKVPE